MKKNILKLLFLSLLFLSFILSCKKKKDEAPTPAPLLPDILCTGNGTNTYYPLAINNAWTFPTISVNPGTFNYIIYNTVEFNSITYFEVFNTQGYVDSYLRADANGDIIMYDVSSSSEFLFIPANPTNNQTWNFAYSMTRKVINTSASVSTASCNYDNCILIETFYSNGDPNTIYYYKKGIGLVSYTSQGLGGVKLDLKHLTLQ